MGGKNQFRYMTTYSGATPGGVAQISPVLDFMNLYWRLKLYDDFDFDVDKGLKEYYQKFFGPGAKSMAKFYTAMEHRWMTQGGGAESRAVSTGAASELHGIPGRSRGLRRTSQARYWRRHDLPKESRVD